MNVVIVESPAKAKTINKYLGSNYTVLASYGHVRDLPSKNGSVDPEDDFSMNWAVDTKSNKRLTEIADALKGADKLILATDPDREGEAISWHVLEVLKKKKALKGIEVERVVFNAITKSSILEAMKHPRELDVPLVDAYLARRALDYLVGFTLSPVLWRKLPSARSAGRVQSVSLRLVCEREKEIEAFNSEEFWTIEVDMKTAEDKKFAARVHSANGKRLDKFAVPNEAAASSIVMALENGSYTVDKVESKPTKRNPYAPFTTSTLQQDASRQLGFSSAHTMQVAQRLYEGIQIDGETQGLITYMRTDGVQIADEAITWCRDVIASEFGAEYVPSAARVYVTKAKNAQEAHEAIRPTDLARLPKHVAAALDKDQLRLYELIWKRTIASQMESARIDRTSVDIAAKTGGDQTYSLRASGSVITFDGFLTLYQEGSDDESEDEDGKRLPRIVQGEKVDLVKLLPNQHFTQPPPRFTEATLIKRMEELGIGRPSTYTSTLTVLRDREYVRLEKKRLIPEDKGRLVTAFLESFFARYVEYDFTASLEEKLDKVSNGDIAWKQVLNEFWTDFNKAVGDISELRVTHVLDALNEVLGPHIFPAPEDGGDPRKCTSCDDGQLSLKVGRFGAFIGCSNYPDCRFTRQFSETGENGGNGAGEDRVLGMHPETELEVWLKSGRFGPYLQLGDGAGLEKGEKPKRAGLPKGTDVAEFSFEEALKLLSLPRDVGAHPETGKMITAGLGRYGPFVLHQGTYANIESYDELFTIGLNRAVTVIAEKAAKGRKTATALKELGEHPDGGPVNVMDGRYGPYVKYAKINATLPKDVTPDTITMEQALELIAAKAAKGGKKKKAAPKKKKAAAKKKTTAKKKAAPKKKPAAKKADKAE